MTYYVLDLESEGSIASFVQQIKEHYGQVDTLVTNAAVFKPGPAGQEQLNLTFRISFEQNRYLIEEAISQDIIRPGGKIVMNSSRAGMMQYMNSVNPEVYEKIKNFEDLSLG